MTRGVNKAIIVGNLGSDPEVKATNNGSFLSNLTIATNESWKDKEGVQQDRTEWHRIVVYGKLAELTGQYLKKGSMVYVEGKLSTRKWTDNNGVDRYTTEIVVDQFNGTLQFLDSRNAGQAPTQAAPQQAPAQAAPQQQVPTQAAPQQQVPTQAAPQQQAPVQAAPQQQAPAQTAPQQGGFDDFDDDIPF